MAKHFGKKDMFFLGALAAVLLIGFIGFSVLMQKPGAVVEVTVAGALYGVYPLNEDRTVEIVIGEKKTNTLVIRDGKADMTEADCPDKLCVRHKAISRENETIVCLPNQVVAEVKGGVSAELDGVA